MVEPLDYLHNVNNLAHLELKPDNFVFNDDLTLALIDFGHASKANEPICQKVGTKAYLPPEVRPVY